jgi:release factor glutamine methyltransferase
MSVDSWLRQAQQKLTAAGVGSARLDALVLLEDTTGQDRALLLAHPETELTAGQLKTLEKQIERRALHVPLAYIRGKTEFYGREFTINAHVLEPRPESETIIELLLQLRPPVDSLVVDIGTGSGALAITAACELPGIRVAATDLDPKCLEVARNNAEKHTSDITFLEGDLLEPLGSEQSYTLLCNLPYVPDGFHINQAAGHEPRLAIFGGPDGLDVYRKLFQQIGVQPRAQRPTHIITESLPPQHAALAAMAKRAGYGQDIDQDFIQQFQLAALPA